MLTPSATTSSGCFPQIGHSFRLSSACNLVNANQTRVKVSVLQNATGEEDSMYARWREVTNEEKGVWVQVKSDVYSLRSSWVNPKVLFQLKIPTVPQLGPN